MDHQGVQLLKDLKAAGITWNVRHEITERQGRQRVIKESVLLVSMTVPAEGGPVTYEEPMQLHWDCALDAALARLMRKHLKSSPIYRAWLDGHGNVPVKLVDGILECVPEAVHTALRKLADGPSSVLTWNAIHHLHEYDRGQLWKCIEDLLKATYEAAATQGKQVQRRALAIRLSEVVKATLEKCRYADRQAMLDEEGKPLRERSPAEKFALLTMTSGVDLTDMSEWMYGWLGYVVEDVPDASGEDEAAAELAA